MLSDAILSPTGVGVLVGVSILGLWLLAYVVRTSQRAVVSSDDVVWRIFRNSTVPILSQFVVRGIDLAVALAVLRLLGPAGNGRYALAVVIWFFVKTLSDFGMGLYATREISRDANRSGELTGGTALFRLAVLIVAVVPVGLYLALRWNAGNLSGEVLAAVAVLMIAIVPGSLTEAINSTLNGIERMETAAGLNVAVNVFRAPLAVLLAATSLGIIGIAIAALGGAIISCIGFLLVYYRLGLPKISYRLSRDQTRLYVRECAPLMVNTLLLSLFFRVDVFVVEAFRGAEAVGLYDAAFKPINLLTIVPAYATLAVFPLMSRRSGDPASLLRATRMTSYVLVILAWAIVVGTLALARPAIAVLAGSAFLPESADLLRILIFFAPLSFLNGVFQYVLIATGRQREIVPAFVAAVVFNLAGNLLLVPEFGVYAAAGLTVATEVVIFLAFVWLSRAEPVKINDRTTMARVLRPTVAGLVGSSVALLLIDNPILAFLVGGGAFSTLCLLLGVVGDEERDLIRRLWRRGVSHSTS